MKKQLRVKAVTGRQVHAFREYMDGEGGTWLVSLCGIRTEPIGLELVDTWEPTTCPTCSARE